MGWELLGLAVGIAGVVVALLTYRWSRRVVDPTFAIHEGEIIGERAAGWPYLEVRFKDAPVSRVTLTIVTIRNEGAETWDGESLTVRDLLRVQVPEGAEILDARAVNRTRDVIGFRVERMAGEPHAVAIGFDFLDQGDGADVMLMHTGALGAVEVLGTVKGVPTGLRNAGAPAFDRPSWSTRRRAVFNALMFAWGVTAGLLVGAIEEGSYPALLILIYGSSLAAIGYMLALGPRPVGRRRWRRQSRRE